VSFRDNNFTDNMRSVSEQYATAAGIETDDEGKAPHIDVPNEDQGGEPVDLANVGVPTGAESQATTEELAPEGAPEANPTIDGATDPVTGETVAEPGEVTDPDALTEEELEAATAPEGETEEEQA